MSEHILISGAIAESAVRALQAKYPVVYKPDCARAELEAVIGTATVLVSRSETDVDAALLDRAPKLKLIARAAVGVGNIDLDCASQRGILVLNTPGKNTNSAAELTFALLLAMARYIPQAHQHTKEGKASYA